MIVVSSASGCESELARRYRTSCEFRRAEQIEQNCRIVNDGCRLNIDELGFEEEGVEQQECLAENVSCDDSREQVPSAEELCGPAYVCFGRCAPPDGT